MILKEPSGLVFLLAKSVGFDKLVPIGRGCVLHMKLPSNSITPSSGRIGWRLHSSVRELDLIHTGQNRPA